MTLSDVKQIWVDAIADLLESSFPDDVIDTLSMQTIDSIRRVKIYETYQFRADIADAKGLPYSYTSNPFSLAQRTSLSIETRVWVIYVATYFGKSDTSKWKLFNNVAFRSDNSLITFEEIIDNKEGYFDYLRNMNFFEGSKYSNHRKYTRKSLDGERGVLTSFEFMLDHMNQFCLNAFSPFDTIYQQALNIPNFGRMAAFDFTCSLSKCGLNVDQPTSMYHKYSTGPLDAINDILILAGVESPNNNLKVTFGDELLNWFNTNYEIYMLAQVLEDAICNWQKSPTSYFRYFG